MSMNDLLFDIVEKGIKHAKAGDKVFTPTAYCYNNNCPARQGERKHPRSDSIIKYIKIKSRKNKYYYKRAIVCEHCHEEMTFTYNINHDEY